MPFVLEEAMARKVISPRQLPTPPGRIVESGLIAWLLLDRFDAVGWVHGIVWTILGLLLVGAISIWVTDEWVTIDLKKRRGS